MLILVLNCGSSSIKSALIDTARRERLLDVRVENIHSPACRLLIDGQAQPLASETDAAAGLRRIFAEVSARCEGIGPVEAVAHRIVHGESKFVQPTVLDDESIAAIVALEDLAPLHNPPALAAVNSARQKFSNVPHVAVFDTAFHATLPPRAREYAISREVSERFGIRRYGFHGTSHSHVAHATADYLQMKPQQLCIVSCHLGNGASVAAIEYGRCVETSMGMTPLEGLVMGTRAGDLDPGILLRLLRSGEFDAESLDRLLNHQSGLKALTGTQDLHDIEARAAAGDEGCQLAITLYAHRVRKYVGAYAAVMGGVDVIAFTGGVGEHSALMRHRIAQRLDFLGLRLDEDRNRDARVSAAHPVLDIAEAGSRTRLMVVRADEELTIALEAAALLAGRAQATGPVPIPLAISARHAHLSQATIDRVFGKGYQLRQRAPLLQPGQYAAQETISLIGPRGRLEGVRLLGPPRAEDQIEISRSDEFVLGMDAPVRISGDLDNTPGITLEGPAGQATIARGVICARRHIHMNPSDAERFGLHDHDSVEVRIDSGGRDLVFGDVVVRVSPHFQLEMHLDTDEANAAGIVPGDTGELVQRTPVRAAIGQRRLTGRVT